MREGKVYDLYRNTCLIARKSYAKTGKQPSSKKRATPDLPGTAPQAQVSRVGDSDGPRAPRTAIPEPANESVPAPIPAASESDDVVVIDPAAVTLSRDIKQAFYYF